MDQSASPKRRTSSRGGKPTRELSRVDQRTATWGCTLSDNVFLKRGFVAERKGDPLQIRRCGMQRTEALRDLGYDGEVRFIHVLQSSQRLGFGSALRGAMAQELRRRELHTASLWSLLTLAARGFYERTGGEIVGEKEDVSQASTRERQDRPPTFVSLLAPQQSDGGLIYVNVLTTAGLH
jgi:GNAT superfamily N-acetyltransferase